MDDDVFDQLDQLQQKDLRGYVHDYSGDSIGFQHSLPEGHMILSPFDEPSFQHWGHTTRHGQAIVAETATYPHLGTLSALERNPLGVQRSAQAQYSPEDDCEGETFFLPQQSVLQTKRTFQNHQPSSFDGDWQTRSCEAAAHRGFHPHTAEKQLPCGEAFLKFTSSHATKQYPNSAPRTQISNYGTPVVQGISLVPTSELPDRLRSIFSFPLFNAVQSKCFEKVYKTNDNFVVCAPTGSGKTALFELAVCRLVNGNGGDQFKIVYQAPTKALCSERRRDWQAKFAHLNLRCAELTGDTGYARLHDVQNASIIITTPEKWDSVTRKWKDHQKLMQMVKLFLIDEVHSIREDRGATLEVVVSRMKSVGGIVRFIALSATVPNAHDIATWLGKDSTTPEVPASCERFGEEFRPVQLQRHVCAYEQSPSSNDFAFDHVLSGKLIDVIKKWSQRKPLMVFCPTRNSCITTAKLLANWWSGQSQQDRYWSAPRTNVFVRDKDVKETVSSGVACHHAKISSEDRTTIEKAYLEGNINVICCTSTLAMGVNLPCHMVIIKGTVAFQASSGAKEYSDLEIMQMLGRAGRPQFGNSAVAIIMTRLHKAEFYEKMISEQKPLESRLHLHLIDHLNSEIGLGTVTSEAMAKKWLSGTFLYVRLKDNPTHYKITPEVAESDIDSHLQSICKKALLSLEQHELIRTSPQLRCTNLGDAMARFYLQFDTMKRFLALPRGAKISEILSAISQAAEYKEIRFRAGEKSVYRNLNKNGSIKFPIPVNIELPAHKISLIFQSVLGAVDLPDEDDKHRPEYNAAKIIIFQHAHRLIRCMVDCQLHLEDSVAARNALVLARSFGAQVWDDSSLHIKQLDGVGLVFVRKLVAAGIRSIEDLEVTESHRIEAAVSRYPPFGTQLQSKAKAFPRLRVTLKASDDATARKGEGVLLKVKAEIGFMNEKVPEKFRRKDVYVCFLADTSDGRKAHFVRTSAKALGRSQDVFFSVILTSPSQMVRGYIMCDEIAGTQQSALLKPGLPGFMFPIPKAEELITNASAKSKQQTAASFQCRPSNEHDEFDDDGIADADLKAIADEDGFVYIDRLDDTELANEPSQTRKTSALTQPMGAWEPIRLSNGKWACNHSCKDKINCKHDCCSSGLDKMPRPPKSRDPKKSAVNPDLKQTQLNVTKKKTPHSSNTPQAAPESTAPADTVGNSFPGCSLTRLHNKAPSYNQEIPLMKGACSDAEHSYHGNIRDVDVSTSKRNNYGSSTHDSAYWTEIESPGKVNDEMLYILGGRPLRTPIHVSKEVTDLTKDDFNLDLEETNEIIPTEKDSRHAPADFSSSSNRSGITFSAGSPLPPLSTSSEHTFDMPHSDEHSPPAKKTKLSPAQTQDIKSSFAQGEDSEVDMPSAVPEAPAASHVVQDDTDSLQDWFYREFGNEFFHFSE